MSPVPAGADLPVTHPLAGRALLLGILSIVFGTLCGLGGFVGLLGITNGLEVRRDDDTHPGRWQGRRMATAGMVTGAIGIVVGLVVTVSVVIIVLTERSG